MEGGVKEELVDNENSISEMGDNGRESNGELDEDDDDDGDAFT